jgi:streptomycin 6-kinase
VLPEVLRNKAAAVGAQRWVADLPGLIAAIEHDWAVRVGRAYDLGTEAFVAEATQADGSPAVLKLMIPRPGNQTEHEVIVLRLTNGDGCVRLFRDDTARGALLLERLGRPLNELGYPVRRRHEILCDAAARVWRPAPDVDLPSGADKAQGLANFITAIWERLGRPCHERAIDYALACTARREAAHQAERAVLVHGDVHQWNALQADGTFKLVDPDGLLAEPEYDLGVLMREDPDEGDLHERARWLAKRTGLDPAAIWEWGVAERVATGLLLTEIGLQPVGRQMLDAAERIT